MQSQRLHTYRCSYINISVSSLPAYCRHCCLTALAVIAAFAGNENEGGLGGVEPPPIIENEHVNENDGGLDGVEPTQPLKREW